MCANIPHDLVILWMRGCLVCATKGKTTFTNLVVKPIITTSVMSRLSSYLISCYPYLILHSLLLLILSDLILSYLRWQIDLVDLRSSPDSSSWTQMPVLAALGTPVGDAYLDPISPYVILSYLILSYLILSYLSGGVQVDSDSGGSLQ